jgi:transcriptional regulator
MQSYIIAGLCAALAVMGLLYRSASGDIERARIDLAVAEQVMKADKAAIERLEQSIAVTDRIIDEWNEDRTTLAQVRSTARQAIKEAMRDETFKVWAASLAPPDAWRVLGANVDAHGNAAVGPSLGATGGLPGNADSGKRQ